jgi:hypothetical protein
MQPVQQTSALAGGPPHSGTAACWLASWISVFAVCASPLLANDAAWLPPAPASHDSMVQPVQWSTPAISGPVVAPGEVYGSPFPSVTTPGTTVYGPTTYGLGSASPYTAGFGFGSGYAAPGGYPARMGQPYYYQGEYGVITGNPYYDHFGPGFHRSQLHGHYRFPYYNYRAPWYYPGRAVYNRDTNFAW